MQKLVQDLLAFSRAGRQGMAFESTDCNAVLQVASKNLAAALQESGAVIEHAQLPRDGDSSQLVQFFQNLIGECYPVSRIPPPLIRVSAELRGKEWLFSVAGKGIGIAAEHVESVLSSAARILGRNIPATGSGSRFARRLSNNTALDLGRI